MEKFHVPQLPSSTAKTIRIPNDLAERIDKIMMSTRCSFNAVVISAIRFALDHLDEENG